MSEFYNKLSVLKNLNIMLIDDDTSTLDEMKTILEHFFKSVYLYEDPQKAIEDFKKQNIKIDVIMTDIRMPIINGLELCSKIREINLDVPIFICSSHTNTQELLSSIKFNLIDYIVKPINLTKLKDSFFLLANRIQSKDEFYLNKELKYIYSQKVIHNIKSNVFDSLTEKEYKLLELLIKNKNSIVEKNIIEDEVYDLTEMTENAFRNLIFRLRKKFETIPIHTVKNIGLILKIKI